MDVTLLRTLAWKSIMGFGKYYDLSVLEVYNLQHTRYLRWCYYNCSMISFNNEILKAIHIQDHCMIDKPGIDPAVHEVLNKAIELNMDKLDFIKMKSRYRKIIKNELFGKDISRTESKGKRMAKNQGKLNNTNL